MPISRFATTMARDIDRWAPVVVFAGLPTVGLLAGPAYSSMIIGLAILQLLTGLATGRGMARVDWKLTAIASLFLLLCWASVTWSISPRDTARASLGLTAVMVAMLLFCATPRDRPAMTETLFHVLLIAALVGIAVARLDVALGYPLQALISTKPGIEAATKYNRGLDYLLLIAWPLLAHAWWRRRWWAVGALGMAMMVMLLVTLSLAARAAVAAGLVVLVLAWVLPRLAAGGLAAGVAVYVLTLPLTLRLLANQRPALVHVLKPSGVARLDIWAFDAARVGARVVQGWGLESAKDLSIRANEAAGYAHFYAGGLGNYPHNQFLELWVELGVLGALLGLAFALLVLHRIRDLPPPIRKFAFAAFASAVTVATVDYEVVTDSWWAALAATGVMFGMLGRLVADETVGGRAA